jgi:ferredoxin-NADP reductase
MGTFKVISIDHLTDSTFHLRTERPSGIIYAGQCFNLGLPGMEINREYSMYSDANADYLDFLIRAVSGGYVSSRLQEALPGDSIEIDGPYGKFCIENSQLNDKFLFIATGTGIAPFHSFIKTFGTLDYKLLHGVRKYADQYHSSDYLQDRYITCISEEKNSGFRHVTNYLSSEKLDLNCNYYLCGNRRMITDSIDILFEKGISGDRIFTEVFF